MEDEVVCTSMISHTIISAKRPRELSPAILDGMTERSLNNFFFDVQILDGEEPRRYRIKDCSAKPPSFSKNFAALRKSLVQIGVANTYQGLTTAHERLPGYLKVTAPGIGHRYIFARWNLRENLESNSIEFVNSAIKFLFPRDKTGIARSETFKIEEKKRLWLYNLDPQSDLFLNEGVQKSFSEITGMESGGHIITQDPEIFIYRTTDKTKQQRAVKERERQKMGQAKSQSQKSLVQEAGSQSDKAVVQSSVDPQLRALKERLASRLQPESVYNNPGGRIGIPKYGPSLEPAIHGGPDFPSIYARVLTLAEIEDLQRQLQLRENEFLQREAPRVCDMTFHSVLAIHMDI